MGNKNLSFHRKSPEELLAQIEKLKRGKLKIYIGSAPGVGKTYRMLTEAHELKKEGIDVVIGLVETHGRKETADLIHGLEELPLKEIPYKNNTYFDLDVDAIIARNPEVVIIDELAHSNIPGSVNEKRYQDVQTILDHRINVISAVNIQHLESLRDVVHDITGVSVRERIPDFLLDVADEVILIDVTAETLQKRLREGKIYATEKIQQSLENFFTTKNLSALREIALREVADDVDDKADKKAARLRAAMMNEKILVCIKNDANAEKLIRRGFRIADRLRSELFILTAISKELDELPEKTQKEYATWQDLAKQFNAHFLVEPIKERKISQVITDVANKNNITQIILGQSIKSRVEEVAKGSIVNAIMRQTDGVDIHIVANSRKN
ncbi:KdpD-like non-kinase potassium sensor [Listeria fleischmannii]|uniref:Universal stress protein n=1 Tax=Listeria fleischmannii TaxID=1069827 RepID=A0A841YFE0_9LIST|nr:KdpD-like non-kinase potassium sensor [Listeria fleischmannii]EIA20870.1 sensor histidine kinase KdpD [Listeria fleischmannii subsp. coloradonensis]MBC1398894.1 universal stress protein [Listeria fleischmannii]MBC1427147.1 universal stress protein [Listeria fleischmannii]STY34057.1 Sensor protein KdpD [Listeria fleischmannii subsp. coloradonensis]